MGHSIRTRAWRRLAAIVPSPCNLASLTAHSSTTSAARCGVPARIAAGETPGSALQVFNTDPGRRATCWWRPLEGPRPESQPIVLKAPGRLRHHVGCPLAATTVLYGTSNGPTAEYRYVREAFLFNLHVHPLGKSSDTRLRYE
jgi:hypothetical protein